MHISFRRFSSVEALKKLVDFLKDDVVRNGGSASEVVDTHGTLRLMQVCAVPWGTIVVNREVTKLEALAWWLMSMEED